MSRPHLEPAGADARCLPGICRVLMRVQRDSPVREKSKLGLMNGSLPLSSKPGFSDPELEPDLEVRRPVQQSLLLAA